MSAIVTNLLHLSSEVTKLADFFGPALELVLVDAGADAGAIVEASLPADWSIKSVRGAGAREVPLQLAADALESSAVVSADFSRPVASSVVI